MINLQRLPDWDERLDRLIDDWRTRRMDWGTHDCAHFACAAVEAVTGESIRDQWPQYTNEAEGRALIHAAGGIAACASQVLGEHISAIQTRRGDIVHVALHQHEWLAVCTGQQAMGLSQHGLLPARAMHFKHCWRIG